MKNSIKYLTLIGGFALNVPSAWSATVNLNFNYIATNTHGSAGVSPVASLTITDLADILTPTQLAAAGEGSGGVRATITNLGTNQFGSGVAGTTTWIGAFELNFPGTMDNEENGLNGYDSAGVGNRWANVSGTPLSGGIEWQEGGATNGWQFFAQEYNFSGTSFNGNSLTQGKSSTIDIFNGAGLTNISVASLLGNPVANSNNPSLPDAYAWIKIRGTTNTDPSLRGVAASGFWGNSVSTSNSYRLDVLAPVPVPAALPLFVSGLLGMGLLRAGKVG
ncbi:hypothetical protein [Methylomonas sp. DH-1]|uniref:hypothetical protein n=1 Tax=Methylomonas sp. (strain DH-1) TaxID=1727196 RepID=UPI0007C90288|nr:hypothetical protein [Methylomonas sp. DH-1]ANE56599.1 hypothetical protein AYM39_16395 [Methylomonas sp. DH-1]